MTYQKMRTRWLIILLVLISVLTLAACSGRKNNAGTDTGANTLTGTEAVTEKSSIVEVGIEEIDKYGNITLTISPRSMQQAGYEPADIISVKIGDMSMEMPIGTGYSDVDQGKPICAFRTSSKGREEVVLAINTGDMAGTLGIAEKQTIDKEPGYQWTFTHGIDKKTAVIISMAEKQGYAEEYAIHRLYDTRSNERTDYPDLSDEEYANFRVVETTGMGKGTLYRSSSPINPALNRNEEADDALLKALIKTVVNLADNESSMKKYADFGLTNYAGCDVIALDMSMDYAEKENRQKLADGFRYLASHEGPYLIHCTEGKDRTGFAAGILECLMGADAEEVVSDYMVTFYNFYQVEPGTPQYEKIAAGNIEAILAKTYGIPSLREEGIDLQACAESYLREIGMNDEEIASLKANLGKNYSE